MAKSKPSSGSGGSRTVNKSAITGRFISNQLKLLNELTPTYSVFCRSRSAEHRYPKWRYHRCRR
jgi:hypothetical protein